MLNSKGNEKKSRPSGQDDKTIIVGSSVREESRENGIYELKSEGKLAKAVDFADYVVIKAYNNEPRGLEQRNQAEIR